MITDQLYSNFEKNKLNYNNNVTYKSWYLYLYIFNSFYSKNASTEHAMLMDGASIEILR